MKTPREIALVGCLELVGSGWYIWSFSHVCMDSSGLVHENFWRYRIVLLLVGITMYDLMIQQ